MITESYQIWTRNTAIYPKKTSIEYLGLGLASEAGEVCGVIKKWMRDKSPLNDLYAELGDVMWYVARLADECGWDLNNILAVNREKLESRLARNKISGSGDNR